MSVKKISVNTLDVKNVTAGVSVVILIGIVSLTMIVSCSSQKKIKSLKQSVKICRKNNQETIKKLRSKKKTCNKKLKSCRKIRNKFIEKIGDYEKRLCN